MAKHVWVGHFLPFFVNNSICRNVGGETRSYIKVFRFILTHRRNLCAGACHVRCALIDALLLTPSFKNLVVKRGIGKVDYLRESG